jgi:hypothetical protein
MNSLCYTLVGFYGGHNTITLVEECDVYYKKLMIFSLPNPKSLQCIIHTKFGHNETF